MKITKKEENKGFAKLTKYGISLIVLIITIIVIIILSTAVIVTISNNNPIDEANVARYESDRDSMQAVFTNTVAKVMAKNQGTVSVTAGQINKTTSGVNSTTGQVSYTVTDAVNGANANGTIVFNKGENTDIVFYTGKQLPIYAAGDTKWYIDSEGLISLRVGSGTYGEGEIVLAPGAYDENDIMLASWDELVNDYGLDIQSNYTTATYNTSESSIYSILNNNENLNSTVKIVMGNDVTKIGNYAFYECSNLENITISDTVTKIGPYAFFGCSSLTSIIIPESVTSIGMYAFNHCGLESIKVNERNTVYDSRENCNAIIETSINELIFGCENTTIPNTVTSIGFYAFYGCSGLTSVEIPDSVTNINVNAFYECTELRSVTIPSSVNNIGMSAFSECSSLTSIIIPDSVTSIGNGAFSGCRALTSIKVDENNTVYDSRENCNAIIETATNKLVAGCSVTVIPNTVTNIFTSAFQGCSELKSITIPSSIKSIGGTAFRGCIGLTSIVIPDSVTSISERAFAGCDELVNIKVDEQNTVYDSRDNCNAIIEKSTNKLIQGCKTSIIPNTVTSIRNYAFFCCRGLSTITIPDSVISIGSGVFYGCDSLTTIYYKGTATGAPWGATNATIVSE